MIDPNYSTTYAQYNEDIILDALLHDVRKGFYVDVGANYPTIDSVTRRFYDKGWRGINIEPIPTLYEQLNLARKRDINIRAGAGNKKGDLMFREYAEIPGHSTFRIPDTETHTSPYVDRKIPVITLKEIFTDNNVQKIHFLKIDVEGFEYAVIQGNDWKKYKPEIICIESNHIKKDWHNELKKCGYRTFINDGLNEFLIATDSWWRTDGFEERVVKLDYHALKQHQAQSWKQDSEELSNLLSVVNAQAELINKLEQENILSLKNRSLRSRIRIAAKGLTTDWLEFKRDSK